MTPEYVIQLLREALTTALWLAAPLMIVGLVVGIAISMLQVLTSIQDSAFSAVPRLVAFLAVFIVALPWMTHKATEYAVSILGNLSRYAK
jgi:flagellar biosynthetic protein FliQ